MEKYLITVKDDTQPSGERSFTVSARYHISAAVEATRIMHPDLIDNLYVKRVSGDYRCDGKYQAFSRSDRKPYGEAFSVKEAEEEPPALGPLPDWRETARRRKEQGHGR